jgi:uncharacterized protein YceK
MRALIPLVVVVSGLVMAGCASSSSYPAPRESPPVRTRCLNDRNEQGNTRPIFFLFCTESP